MSNLPIIGSFFPKPAAAPAPVVLPAPAPPASPAVAASDPAAAAARAQALAAGAKAKGRQSTLFTPGLGAGDPSKAPTAPNQLFAVKTRPGD